MLLTVREIKKEMSRIDDEEQQLYFLKKALMNYKTHYVINYSDYDKTEYYESIKVYTADEYNFIMLISNYDKRKTTSVTVALFNEEPVKPHPIFPMITPTLKNAFWVKEYVSG